MVNREFAWNPEGRQLVAKRLMWFQSAIDVLSVIFWNEGPLRIIHTILSFTLIVLWLGLPPLWISAAWTSGGSQEWMSAMGLVLVTCLAFTSFVKLALLSDSNAWQWYMWEWICISFQGVGMIVTGAGLPASYQIKHCQYSNGRSCWEAEVEGVTKRRLIMDDDLE